MSYRSFSKLSGLGDDAYFSDIGGTCPAWFDQLSAQGSREICTGGITADPCSYVCCLLPTWSNDTFRRTVGDVPWQAWLEKKIREGVGALVQDRLAAEKRFSTAAPLYDFQKVAWNQGIANVDDWKRFGDRLKLAVSNFNVLFPGARWQEVAEFKKKQTDLRISITSWNCIYRYRTNPKPAERTAAFKAALAEIGVPEEQFEAWAKNVFKDLLQKVPTSGPTSRIGTIPTIPGELLSWSKDGVLNVGAWLNNFVATFQGKRGKVIALYHPSIAKAVSDKAAEAKQAAAKAKQAAVKAAAEAKQASLVAKEKEAEKKASSQRATMTVGTGIAAIVAAGAAYWYATKKE